MEFGIFVFVEAQEMSLRGNLQCSKCDGDCIFLWELFAFYGKVPSTLDPVGLFSKYFYPNQVIYSFTKKRLQICYKRRLKNFKKTLWPLFFMDGVQLPQGYSHFEEAVYFLPFSSQKFLVLILSTSEKRKAESTLEPPSGFEHRTPELAIQRLNH